VKCVMPNCDKEVPINKNGDYLPCLQIPLSLGKAKKFEELSRIRIFYPKDQPLCQKHRLTIIIEALFEKAKA